MTSCCRSDDDAGGCRSSHPPAVTIVTPTHNRRESLRRTLLALADQDYPSACCEVVVIADGCRDDTVELLKRLRPDVPYRLRWIEQGQLGPAEARNRGIAAARGEVIAFLDDDVVPVRNWLSRHMAHHATSAQVVVIGPLSPGSRQRPAWVRWEDATLQQQYRAMLAGEYRATPRQFYTGNSSVRRRWVRAVGGFDARLRRAEDVEMAFRLQDFGLSFTFDPLADGVHQSHRTYRSWQAIPRQYGQNDARMGRERGRGTLLDSIGREFTRRQRGTRLLARLCIGRPVVYRLAIAGLGALIRAADHLGHDRLSMAACSGVWNVAYWQGLADTLGGSRKFWNLVAPPPGETSRLAIREEQQ